MLPYQEDKNLEILLRSLFEDDDNGSNLDGVIVLGEPVNPLLFGNCCNYSYASFGS